MNFGVLWFIGIVITIGTRIAINAYSSGNSSFNKEYYIEARSKNVRVIMNVLVIICIILVGGLANGMYLGCLEDEERIWVFILAGIIPAILTYAVGYIVLGLYHFSSKISQGVFFIFFIISIIGWTIPIRSYNRNIETIKEITTTSTQKRSLWSFGNIPVQEVSGKISGSAYSLSGEISTLDELPYWYANENNEGLYGTATAQNSKLVEISDGEKPYLEIISYSRYSKQINHNNGSEKIYNETKWEEYIFHLPKEIIQSLFY